jgi:hypothetical protein
MAVRATRFDDLVVLLRRAAESTPKPVRIFSIGTQGSGKSTLGLRLKPALADVGELQLISPDRLRLDLYRARHPDEPPDYRKLQRFLTGRRENAIKALARQMFLESDSRVAYLDRMNLTVESRAPFLSPANYNIAVVLKPRLDTILERHRTRPDKAEVIPDWVVAAGYKKLEMPEEDEFDLVVLYEPAPHMAVTKSPQRT